ncbi:CDP-diacylglycerol--glycerol-3-phosphate 3-phosphatidyltransferase [Desulfuromonas thiophila]|jgi:CDP-diacylglycerol--glycerol-3-phosphate 3-phosphatidyltransferase|uniref:CDP-diacylglycerol--glycerol-3-phosphate 3-phosphatidyltransferase n=1 Tax=Desulfuromonas thiophila TaxID=57664 RepID=A0A1G7ALV0_9BACT|nr:CDP-diacylglycerol--glycerol-3-phosphate 3-phosphatidyltransferase [Desulfuromonas thiophila]MDD3801105.1 CDP-diacylglycerol--glycerol-3-phosphate 3-phosphatidyltransferase [Desulfuromonas thiophila]MDY0398484.1 CDP-diacylglycerol--glycerol-3-phosphate 3-phosphatidyltransferase [Desulfuromonas thiophila]SDE15819.1 CDP-diacylglycerol--glycerol-3-phosphate 3-phosphatidyltransferase [Desulfuromonas thiophila]
MLLKKGPFNLPNLLTMARMACVPVVVMLLLEDSRLLSFWATVVFGFASITDWLDGYLARKWQLVTVLGKFLDPLADKLLVMAALIMMIPLGRVPAWAVFLIIAREVFITGLRSVASSEGIVIDASSQGKYKTIFQMVAIVALLLHYDYYWLFGLKWELFHVQMHNVGLFFFYISLVLTLWSGGDYLYRFYRLLTR